MRCTQCDLPLSPTGTTRVCPRCHMPVVTGTNTAAKSKGVSASPQPPSWGNGVVPPGWQDNSGSVVGTFQPLPPSISPFPASQQTPYPQPGQMWLPMSTPPSTPAPLPGISGSHVHGRKTREDARPLPHLQTNTHKTPSVHNTTSNWGFIIAGACVLTGGLLLILVYVLTAGLSPSTVQTQNISTGNSVTSITQLHTPTAVVPTSNTKPSPTTSTGAFPAQQYITDPQMASVINTNTAQVIQAATTFKVGQRAYVTFAIHPGGHSGAVCLQWYANGQTFSHFEFAISSSSTVAYSYTYYAASGPAYVEIFWASSVSCSDELLAQRINFTVVP